MSPKVSKLPSYEPAVQLPPTSDPRCFYEESTDATQFPLLVPFATYSWKYGSEKRWAARPILKQAQKAERPDVIVFYEGGSSYAGSVGSATAVPLSGGGAFATGFSVPVYEKALNAVCYRLAPAALGFSWDSTGMVVSMTEDAKSSGILEGDRIVSIAGAPVTLGEKWLMSPHYPQLLASRPGDEVPVIWIRPGTGRMEGALLLQKNPPSYLEMEAADMTSPRPTVP